MDLINLKVGQLSSQLQKLPKNDFLDKRVSRTNKQVKPDAPRSEPDRQ